MPEHEHLISPTAMTSGFHCTMY